MIGVEKYILVLDGRSLKVILKRGYTQSWASLVAQTVKNPSAVWQPWVRSLGWEDLWRRARQPTPVFLPGESPWTEELGGLQSMGSQRVRHDWATKRAHTQSWKEFCGPFMQSVQDGYILLDSCHLANTGKWLGTVVIHWWVQCTTCS